MGWIRLSQFGCRNWPLYRVIATDGRSPLDGKHLEVLGYYNPFAGKECDLLKAKQDYGTTSQQGKECDLLKAKQVHGTTSQQGIVAQQQQPIHQSMLLKEKQEYGATSQQGTVGLRPLNHSRQRFLFSRMLSHVPGTIPKLFESKSKLPAQDEDKSQKEQKQTCLVLGNNQLLLDKIDEALSENKRKLDKSFLKHWYETKFRPILACNCLLLPEGLSSNSTAFLHKQYHKLNRTTPQYLSAYELMLQRVRIENDDEWDHFWNQIISSRVFIVDKDWHTNVGNVETLQYDYGMKGFYKGEVDASFHDGKNGESGKATISFIIWREDKIICAEVFRDLDCRSIHVAEAYAVLALFFKCSEMKIKDLVLWTDNSDIQGSITGSYTVKHDRGEKERDLLLLLGCMKKEFSQLVAMCKPRELMFLADHLANDEGTVPKLQDITKGFNYQLSQKAVFRLSFAGSTTTTVKNFKNMMYVRQHQTKCFLLVDHLDKLDAVAQIIETLRPSSLSLAIHKLDEKPKDFQSWVKQMTGLNPRQGILKDDCTILHHTTEYDGKKLVVVVDGTLPKDRYDFLGWFTVILVSTVEQKELDSTIEEISALSYRYFSGVVV